MNYLFSLIAFMILSACANNTSETPYSQIQYKAGACFGTCPMFEMTINPDRTAIIDAERFTFEKAEIGSATSQEKEGTFRATITEQDYKTLITMLNDLDVKLLQPKYGSRNVTDLPTSYLTVNYYDGTKKTVEDYGKAGSPKLRNLYQFLEDLRFSQTWTKVD